MATLFALGTIGFFILLAIYIISAIIALENDSHGWAWTFTVITFAALLFMGTGPVIIDWFHSARTNTGVFIMEIVGWIIAGVLWSFFKWWIFLRDWKSRASETSRKDRSYWPQASDNKARITNWMIYWPLSVIGFILNKPIRRMFTFIYEQVSGAYDKITEATLG